MQDLAYQLHCYHFSTSSLAKYYVNEALNLTKDIELWSPSASKVALGKPDVKARPLEELVKTQGDMLKEQQRLLAAQQRQIDALLATQSLARHSGIGHVESGGCDPSSTAFECWTAAYQALGTATALVKSVENQTRMLERKWEASFQTAELTLAAAQANFTTAKGTFLDAAKAVFLQKKGPQTYEGDLTFTRGGTLDLTNSGNVKTQRLDVDTLTGHAWNTTAGKGARIRVMANGRDQPLDEYITGIAAGGAHVYSCNCYNAHTDQGCKGGQVSFGYRYYCQDSNCKNSWTPVMDTSSNTGITCCDICTGTKEEMKKAIAAMPSTKLINIAEAHGHEVTATNK